MPIEIWCKGKSKDTEKQNILYIQEAGTSKCRSKMTQMIKLIIKFVENHDWSSVCSINIFSERNISMTDGGKIIRGASNRLKNKAKLR